jgi:hypothetical protein
VAQPEMRPPMMPKTMWLSKRGEAAVGMTEVDGSMARGMGGRMGARSAANVGLKPLQACTWDTAHAGQASPLSGPLSTLGLVLLPM